MYSQRKEDGSSTSFHRTSLRDSVGGWAWGGTESHLFLEPHRRHPNAINGVSQCGRGAEPNVLRGRRRCAHAAASLNKCTSGMIQ